MKKTAFTITMLLIFLTITMLVFVACSDNAVDDKLNSETIISEEILEKIAQYYPDEVNFQFTGQEKITDESDQDGFVSQECYLFDVIYENKKVSGVAVGIEDSSIWFLDMASENLWFSEGFMGSPRSAVIVPKEEPVLDFMGYRNDNSPVNLYFAKLNTIPEFSNQNEGSVQWNEKENTLRIRAVKGTGSVTGAVDGPLVDAVITWKNGIPELVSVDYEPAPIFSHPEQVIFSGEVMDIEEDRLIEIAEYFKDLIDKKLNEIEYD